jgi:hypothetical protein
MISSITEEQLPANVKVLATTEDGLHALEDRYDGDPRITEVVRMGTGFEMLEQVRWFLGDDLPEQGRPALEALAASAPDDVAPDVAALIEVFPTPDRLAGAEHITGPGDSVAIPRDAWERARPSIEHLIADAEDRCGLQPATV